MYNEYNIRRTRKNSKFIELLKNVENKQSPIVISGLNDVGMIQLGTAINEFGKSQYVY